MVLISYGQNIRQNIIQCPIWPDIWYPAITKTGYPDALITGLSIVLFVCIKGFLFQFSKIIIVTFNGRKNENIKENQGKK